MRGVVRYFRWAASHLFFVDMCVIVLYYECGGGGNTPCHSGVHIHPLLRVVYGRLLFLCVFQHLQEYAVDRLGGVFSIPGQRVGVYAKGIHIFTMAYKVFDLPGG